MKRFLTKIASVLILTSVFSQGHAQTATSVANGNFRTASTWDCTCIPLPGYVITINHKVALDTNIMIVSPGSILVNNGGSLMANDTTRNIFLNGGIFTSHDSVSVHYFLAQTGSFTNSGIFHATSLANYVPLSNTGTFLNIDSIFNQGSITNNGTFATIDSITNSGTFINNGPSVFHEFTNTGDFTNHGSLSFRELTNTGTFTNSDTIQCQLSMWNYGTFNNAANAKIEVGQSVINNNVTTHHAVMLNNGLFHIQSSLYNMDTLKGATGQFQVLDTTYNSGILKGSFDICDSTPPLVAPFIDLNLGTIGSGITWCSPVSAIVPASFDEYGITVTPNPASSVLSVTTPPLKHFIVSLYSCTGQLIYQASDLNTINVSRFENGLYIFQITAENRTLIKKIQILK